jgi:hypothetical protein
LLALLLIACGNDETHRLPPPRGSGGAISGGGTTGGSGGVGGSGGTGGAGGETTPDAAPTDCLRQNEECGAANMMPCCTGLMCVDPGICEIQP